MVVQEFHKKPVAGKIQEMRSSSPQNSTCQKSDSQIPDKTIIVTTKPPDDSYESMFMKWLTQKQTPTTDLLSNKLLHYCKYCPYKTDSELLLRRHAQNFTHISNNPKSMLGDKALVKKRFRCKTCGLCLARKSTLLLHMKSHNELKTTQGKQSQNLPKSHENKKDIRNPKFDVQSPKLNVLPGTENEPINYQCLWCSFQSNSVQKIEKHEASHSSIQKEVNFYTCEQCGYRTLNRFKMIKHYSDHENRIHL